MKRLYKKAAMNIVSGNEVFACGAIENLGGDATEFQEIFKPEKCYRAIYWGHFEEPENQLARSLALLLMAEITRA